MRECTHAEQLGLSNGNEEEKNLPKDRNLQRYYPEEVNKRLGYFEKERVSNCGVKAEGHPALGSLQLKQGDLSRLSQQGSNFDQFTMKSAFSVQIFSLLADVFLKFPLLIVNFWYQKISNTVKGQSKS